MGITANVDGIQVALLELSCEPVAIMPILQEILADTEITVKDVTNVALPLPGHASTVADMALLVGARVNIAATDGAVAIGIPIWSDTFVKFHALGVVRKWGDECLTRPLAHMPDKQAAMPPFRRPPTSSEG